MYRLRPSRRRCPATFVSSSPNISCLFTSLLCIRTTSALRSLYGPGSKRFSFSEFSDSPRELVAFREDGDCGNSGGDEAEIVAEVNSGGAAAANEGSVTAGGDQVDGRSDGSDTLPQIAKVQDSQKLHGALPPPPPRTLALKPPVPLDHELLRGGAESNTVKTPMSLTRRAGYALGGDVGPVLTPTRSRKADADERLDLDQQSRGNFDF